MKTVCGLDMCTGCMACADICPTNAITVSCTESAYNSVINKDLCINCEKCNSVCPNNNPVKAKLPIEWFQGWCVDDDIRLKGASGGYATAIARSFVKKGGAVSSCFFEKGEFRFAITENEAELEKFSGSKYVKSNPVGIYNAILQKLGENKKVLFIGLPCQVAALTNYIKAPLNENLYTVDIICHGAPSPKLLEIYLLEQGVRLADVKNIEFRNNNQYRLTCDGKILGCDGVTDSYMSAFLDGYTICESCYTCKYAKPERVGDLTLGDSWGSDLGAFEFKKGLSLALCQTLKGKELLELAELNKLPVDLEGAINANRQLKAPMKRPANRDAFFKRLAVGKSFEKTMLYLMPKSSLKRVVKAVLIRLGIKKV